MCRGTIKRKGGKANKIIGTAAACKGKNANANARFNGAEADSQRPMGGQAARGAG